MGGRVDVSTVLSLIEADGFTLERTSGSHHIYSKNGHPTPVVVPWSQKGGSLPLGTAKSAARQAGPHIEEALNDVIHGGKKMLKNHVKALKKGMSV